MRGPDDVPSLTELLARAFDAVNETVCIADLENNIIYVNAALLRVYGYTQDELIGQPLGLLITPSNQPELLAEILSSTLRGGWKRELLNRRKDGVDFPISLSTCVLRDDAGNAAALMASGFDITDRKRTEKDLRESGERYRNLIEHASDIIYTADAKGRFTYFNSAAIRTLKIPFLKIMYHHYLDLIHPDQRAAARRFYRQQFAGKIPLTRYEFCVITPDDRPLWVSQNVQIVFRDGKIDGFQAVCRDITDRKLAEIALKEAQRHRQELIDSIDGIVWEADAATFGFRFVSQKAERLLGFPARDWLGGSNFWHDHIHPDDRERTINHYVSAAARNADHEIDYRMIAADGRIVWLHDLITVVAENNQPVLLRGIMVDITQRVHLEDQLVHARKLLRSR